MPFQRKSYIFALRKSSKGYAFTITETAVAGSQGFGDISPTSGICMTNTLLAISDFPRRENP